MKYKFDNTANLKYLCDSGIIDIPPIPIGRETGRPPKFNIGDRVTSTPIGRWLEKGNIWGTVTELSDNQNGYLRYMVLWDNSPNGNSLIERSQNIRL